MKIKGRVFSSPLWHTLLRKQLWLRSPSFRCIKGPYFLARSLNFRCGVDVTRWGMFPMLGSFHGPGGMLELTWFW